MKQKYFDCHFHIIDKNFPVVPNQGFMLAVQRKEKKLRLYREAMDIPTLLKMRAG